MRLINSLAELCLICQRYKFKSKSQPRGQNGEKALIEMIFVLFSLKNLED